MASIGRDKRTGKIVVRVYAGVKPITKKSRTISETLSADATDEEIAACVKRLEKHAAVFKKNSATMTIGSAIDYWFIGMQLADVSPTTLSSYESYIKKHIKPRIGNVFFDKADSSTFSMLYRNLRKPKKEGGAGLSAATVEKMHAMLSGCFSTLKSDGVIKVNPLSDVKVPRAKPPEVQPLLPEDFTKLLQYLQETLHTNIVSDDDFETYMFANLVWVDLHTGLRRGELAGLQEKHLQMRQGDCGLRVARVLIQIGDKHGASSVSEKDPKSTMSKRFVTLDSETASIVKAYLGVRSAVLAEHGVRVSRETPLFCHADGSCLAPSQITDGFKFLVEKLGLSKGVHLHTLRHTHASYLIDHGVSIKNIQERLGHASSKTTLDIYGHLLPGRDREVARAFADITRELTDASVEEDGPAIFIPTCPLTGDVCARFKGRLDKKTSEDE